MEDDRGLLLLLPAQVEAVTRGVRVRASVVFQLDNPMPGGQGLLFAYRHVRATPLSDCIQAAH
jgi:hypothetical protein